MKRVILDVDVGLDDALALLVLLNAEKRGLAKIEGIVCSNGNTSVHIVSKNVVRLLEIAKRTDIPVFYGAHQPLLPQTEFRCYFGDDGFGNLDHLQEPNVSIIRKEPGAIAMNDIVTKYPGEVSIICLASLTNVALAIKLYAEFTENVKEFCIMGGNYSGTDNTNTDAEFNFCIDPEAAHIVLACAKRLVTLLPWETCTDTNISYDWRLSVLGKSDNPIVQHLNRAEESIKQPSDETWIPADAFLAVAFLYPLETVTKYRKCCAKVELHGHETRAKLVIDHSEEEPNVIIIEKVNQDFAMDIFTRSANNT